MVNSVVPKENTDLIFWLQDNTNHSTRVIKNPVHELMPEKRGKIQVKIIFIRSFCCLSSSNNFLFMNMQIIFGLNYHSLSVVCWCGCETSCLIHKNIFYFHFLFLMTKNIL